MPSIFPMIVYRVAIWILHSLRQPVAKLRDCVQTADDEMAKHRSRLVKVHQPIYYVPTMTPIMDRPVLESKFFEHILCQDFAVVGIFGIGGVGKTTLLQKINNDIFNKWKADDATVRMFEIVVWVTVSQDWSFEKVQEEILKCIYESPVPKEQYSQKLRDYLVNKNFMLILDDVWEMLDLDKLGVPLGLPSTRKSKSKVIFTTRFEEVCQLMGCSKTIEVPILSKKESWKLFGLYTSQTFSGIVHPTINEMAEELVSRCLRLPLAIQLLGTRLARCNSEDDWLLQDNILKMTNYKFPELIDKVVPCLKSSFDGLQSRSMQSCLLYCCSYPEDSIIDKEQLIEKWLREGFLEEAVRDDCQGVQCLNYNLGSDMLQSKGHAIIDKLRDACLLEVVVHCESGTEWAVKMHPLVREIGLEILEDTGGMGEFLARARRDVNGLNDLADATEKMSRIRSKVTGSFTSSSSNT